jgi:hypothetical protein
MYRSINSTKIPASGADFSELTSQVRRVSEDRRVFAKRAVEKPIFFVLRNKCNHVIDVGGPYVCENRVEGCHAK